MRKTKRKFGCPVEFSIDLLSGKWKTVILSRLKLRPMRYGELRQDIPSLSDKILTERLRDLCEAGFVRQERSGAASRYSLTKRGEMLKPMLQALYDWGSGQRGVVRRPFSRRGNELSNFTPPPSPPPIRGGRRVDGSGHRHDR